MTLPFLRAVVPPHVFCLLADGVSYASVRRTSPVGFAEARTFAYPAGSLGSGASGTPLFSREALSEAVTAARRLADGRLTRASVVFPDAWARILPIEFDALPDSESAMREMVLWKLKKLLPGVTSELSLTFREMPPTGSAKRLLVAAAPAESLASIEDAFESLGVRVGLLAPASLVLFEGLAGVLGARAAGDYALVHRTTESFAFAIARNGTPLFFRQRPASEEPVDHDQEVRLSISYYQEKLEGPGLSAVFVHDGVPGGIFPGPGSFPVPPVAIGGGLFGADPDFDPRIAARPELLAGFAAVYGRG